MTNLFVNAPNQTLMSCAECGDLAGLARLLAQGADPRHGGSPALRLAAGNGHVECVKLLIPLSDPKANNSEALRWAAEAGHTDCVRLLIPLSDPKADGSHALRLAAANGHVDIFKLLLSVSDPLIEMKGILSGAIGHGDADILSIMFGHEPRFLELLDLPSILGAAIAKKQSELALFLGSVIEQKILAANPAPPFSRHPSSTAPRL